MVRDPALKHRAIQIPPLRAGSPSSFQVRGDELEARCVYKRLWLQLREKPGPTGPNDRKISPIKKAGRQERPVGPLLPVLRLSKSPIRAILPVQEP